MTQLGKILVFANLVLSVLMAAFAFWAYAQRIDWTAKPDPELDKRNKRVKELQSSLLASEARWKSNRGGLLALEQQLPADQKYYADQFTHARTTANRQNPVKAPVYRDGRIAADGNLGIQVRASPKEVADALAQAGVKDDKGEAVAGAEVVSVAAGSPAAHAGILANDVLVALDFKKVKNAAEWPKLVAGLPLGRLVPVELLRISSGSGRMMIVQLALTRPLMEDAKDWAGEPLLSLDSYTKKHIEYRTAIKDTMNRIDELVKENKTLTDQMASDRNRKGLRERLAIEQEKLAEVKKELEYLKRLATNAEVDSERLIRREKQLKDRVQELSAP